MDEIVDSDVAALTSAHRGGPLLASLPGAGDLTMAAAYDVQTKLVAGLGAPIVGWKLAHSTTKAQQAKGLSEPTVGRLLKGMIRAPGLSLGSAEINAPEVEPEICVVLARDLPPGGAPYSVDAVRTAVGATHFAMEVASNRYRVKADQPLPAVIADNNGAHSLILGDVIAPDDFAAVSTAAISVTLGDGTNVPGFAPEDRPDIHATIAFLANYLAGRGEGLAAGAVITTGTCAPPQRAQPGANTCSFDGFQTLTFHYS